MEDITLVKILGAVVLIIAATVSAQEPQGPAASWHELERQGVEAEPPLPPLSVYPAQLVLDDNTAEGVFGIGGLTARQFLWFQQFTAPSTNFDLEEIWVLFPEDPGVAAGAPIQLVVYRDFDGEPADGAQLLWSEDQTIQSADGVTFSIYPVSPALEFRGGGDILIGVVNRFVTSGTTPLVQPALLDTSSSAGRAWVTTWTGDPPLIPTLPGDQSLFLIDDLFAGNWMIRGFGSGELPGIPTLGPWALALLVAALGFAGLAVLRWRR